MTEAAGHNRKQSPLRTSKSCRCISMKKLAEIDIDDGVMYIQLFSIFEHICVDLQPFFGNRFGKTVAVTGKGSGIGNITLTADNGVFSPAVA